MEGIFNFTESTWVEIIWYVPFGDSDLLAVLFREPADGPWLLRYRFRYYADDRVWDDDDVKNVYDIENDPGVAPATIKEKLINASDAITQASAEKFGGEVFRLVVRGHAKKALKMLSRQPWTHRKDIRVPWISDRVQ